MANGKEHLELPRRLARGLVLRSVESSEDVEKVARLNREVHDEEAEAWSRWYLISSPGPALWRNCLLVDDEATGQVLSTLFSLPRAWSFEGLPLRANMVELVSTHVDYRGRGLIRSQMEVVRQLERSQGVVVSCIAGIPYFYRQFGYEYSLTLGGGWLLRYGQVPALGPGEVEPVTLRPFVADSDLAGVSSLYDAQRRGFCLFARRDDEAWRSQSGAPVSMYSTYTVLGEQGEVVGYLRLEPAAGAKTVFLTEAAMSPEYARYAVFITLLRCAARAAAERGFDKIRVTLWDAHPLAVVARSLGAELVQRYAWQVRLPDEAAFLRAVRPALERRLAESILAGYSGMFDLNLYCRLLRVRFDHGELVSIDDEVAQQDVWTARIPPSVAAMLLLGYRSWDELRAWYPDVTVRPEARLLADILFPKRPSHVFAL